MRIKSRFVYVQLFIIVFAGMEITARIFVSYFLDTSFFDPSQRLRESRTMKNILALPPRDSTKYRVLVLAGSPCAPARNNFNALFLRALDRPNAAIYNLATIGKTGVQSSYEYHYLRHIHFDRVLYYQGINDFKKSFRFNVEIMILNHPECPVTAIPLALHHFALHHMPEPVSLHFLPRVDLIGAVRSVVEISKEKKENLILPTFAYWTDTANIRQGGMRARDYNDPKVLQNKLEELNSFIRHIDSPYLQKPDIDKTIPKNAEFFFDVCHFTKPGTELFFKGILAENRSTLPFPGLLSDYHGYVRHNFICDGCDAILVDPSVPAAGNPWVWRAEFFDQRPELDLMLLSKGFHLAYLQVGNTFGCPSAMKHWEAFYHELTELRGLSKKPAIEAVSRGGLYAGNWAVAHPKAISCLYLDNAVLDFKSWPGGKGRGPGSRGDWKMLLKYYGFTEETEAMTYGLNPIDCLAPLAKAGVPLFFLCGDADEFVPFEENGKRAKERYDDLGGSSTLMVKKGGKHNPHGLDDPTPIVDFILKSTAQR